MDEIGAVGQCGLQQACDTIGHHADDDGKEIEVCQDAEVLLFIRVDAEQHGHAESGTGREPRHRGAKRQRAVDVQLRDQNGGRAVGNQADQRRHDR